MLRLRAAGLTLNLAKCQFFRTDVKFLGHVSSGQGLATDPDKVQSMRDWPQPRTAKDVSSFVGLCSYFRKHVKDFAATADPLFRLTSKDVQFQWSPEADDAFVRLKRALSEAPVVASPGSVKELELSRWTVTPVRGAPELSCCRNRIGWNASLHMTVSHCPGHRRITVQLKKSY